MSAFFPRNYGGFPSQIHFGRYRQKNNQYYDKELIGQQPFFPSFYPIDGYNQLKRPNFTTDLIISLNRLNEQYQYGQRMRHMNKMQKEYWGQQATTIPLPMYTEPFPSGFTTGPIYEYEKETRFLPYPVFVGQGMGGFGGGGMGLPPKIRVIFMPTGFPSLQQPCAGPLDIPSFLFNRMSQPFCSFPLPPPLPQIGSLPLTPAVQQMVMQQYANPLAVFPFTPNWQMCQPMMPSYPQVLEQQQQPMMPLSALEPFQSALQPYIPPTLMPVHVPMLPSDTSPLLSSNPVSSIPQYSNFGYPNICRACPPAPPSLNIPVTGHCWVQHCSACHHVPADATNPNDRPTNGRITPLLRHPIVPQNFYTQPTQQQQQQQQYPHINTSITMRPWLHTMPPLPPGAVIISDGYINKNGLNQASYYSQQHPIQHSRVNDSVARSITTTTMNTNKNKKNKGGSRKKRHKKRKDYKKSRSKGKSNSTTSKSSSSVSNTNFSSTSLTCSSSNSSTSTEHKKSDNNPQNNKQNLIRKQLSTEARNVNLHYNYEHPDLSTVYHTNSLCLKSTDEDSASRSNSSVSPISPILLIIKEYNHNNPLPPIYFNSMKEEEEEEEEKSEREDVKSFYTVSSTPFQSEQPRKRIIIIREFARNSPSTISTISSSLEFSIIDNDFDSISTTSTIKNADNLDENDSIISETF